MDFQKSCQLVEVNDAEENDWITKNVLTNVSCEDRYDCTIWTGANDRENESYFVWEYSKSPVGDLRWSYGNPNGGQERNCVDMFYDGEFNDRPCYYKNAYMCEWDGFL
ncbi:pulmonary surfactant-associated protein A2-like [Saccostrea cucullata]|uniref:pulmonary surfactant-associated protein A2-like n=1 Tax=Saccostrea cuccullata TaxID=36930 RepID=UPI002ED46FAF